MKALCLVFLLVLVAYGQEKQWKRASDLPDIDENDNTVKEEDPAQMLKDMEAIFDKYGAGKDRQFTRIQYKEVLKDLTIGSGRHEGKSMKISKFQLIRTWIRIR